MLAAAARGDLLAGVVGRTDLFVSSSAEHQGPDGGGAVAVIGHLRSAAQTTSG